MRAARLLELLVVLQVRGRVTTRALADEFQVSERTIQRDVDALSEAGVPVVAHRGAGGGIELLDSYETRLTGFTEDEVEALALALRAGRRVARALGFESSAAAAERKLLAALPASSRRQFESVPKRFEAAPTDPPDPALAATYAAIRHGKRLYLRRQRGRKEIAFAPERVIQDQLGWSLEGQAGGARQHLRFDDIRRVRVSAQPTRQAETD